jgi:hypothetical protein
MEIIESQRNQTGDWQGIASCTVRVFPSHKGIITCLLKYCSIIENNEGTWAKRKPESGIE